MNSKVRKLFFIGKREEWGRGNGNWRMGIRGEEIPILQFPFSNLPIPIIVSLLIL